MCVTPRHQTEVQHKSSQPPIYNNQEHVSRKSQYEVNIVEVGRGRNIPPIKIPKKKRRRRLLLIQRMP